MVCLYGRVGRLTAQNGGFRPGQSLGVARELGVPSEKLVYVHGTASPGR
jgi:hypothetical protein